MARIHNFGVKKAQEAKGEPLETMKSEGGARPACFPTFHGLLRDSHTPPVELTRVYESFLSSTISIAAYTSRFCPAGFGIRSPWRYSRFHAPHWRVWMRWQQSRGGRLKARWCRVSEMREQRFLRCAALLAAWSEYSPGDSAVDLSSCVFIRVCIC